MDGNPLPDAKPQPAEERHESEALAAWEAQLEAAGAEPAGRRNGFDAARKRSFLKALAKGATLTDAAKAARVSNTTVYNHQESDPNFAAACRAAVEVSAPKIELAAYERGVTGVEEEVIQYGKHVGTRVKRSDALLQTLLKGSNPDKYGPRAGFKHKFGKRKWRERERAKIRKEVEAEIEAEQEVSEEEAEAIRERIMRRLMRVRENMVANEGYTLHEETDTLVPAGWVVQRAETLCVSCQERQLCQAS